MVTRIPTSGFLRLPQVLEIVPVSKSSWWAGCKTGRYPAPVKLGPRTTAWRAEDIAALVERLGQKGERPCAG
jgi:predicted DNA-binding transcriptional regulator AlpA